MGLIMEFTIGQGVHVSSSDLNLDIILQGVRSENEQKVVDLKLKQNSIDERLSLYYKGKPYQIKKDFTVELCTGRENYGRKIKLYFDADQKYTIRRIQ